MTTTILGFGSIGKLLTSKFYLNNMNFNVISKSPKILPFNYKPFNGTIVPINDIPCK